MTTNDSYRIMQFEQLNENDTWTMVEGLRGMNLFTYAFEDGEQVIMVVSTRHMGSKAAAIALRGAGFDVSLLKEI